MISIDFLLSLPKSAEGNDALLVVVDKFTKQTMLEPCTNNVSAPKCADLLYNRLLTANWGLPKVILSDRDRRFLAAMWSGFWKAVGTKLVHSTAYHPQTDGQTERMIQSIESAIRMYVNQLDDMGRWQTMLPRIQFEFNNTKSAATGRSPNELLMGFTPNDVAMTLTDQTTQLLDKPKERLEAHDAIALAAMTMKFHYDRKHTTRFFEVGDQVLIRLSPKGYTIPSQISQKYSPKYAGPFPIIGRVGRSAYRLSLPDAWRIHPVISVDHLELYREDGLQRRRPHTAPIRIADCRAIDILDQRQVGDTMEWLVKYENLDARHNQWVTTETLARTPGGQQLLDARMQKESLTELAREALARLPPAGDQ